MKVCKKCGKPEGEHHEPDWLEIPEGCVCDWLEWNYETKISLPPVCVEYVGDGFNNCDRCEHDKACHMKASNDPDQPRLADRDNQMKP